MGRRPIFQAWTYDDEGGLRRMWKAGVELNQIAKALHRTKAAVAVKARKLGLPRRAPSIGPTAPRKDGNTA
jgi:hypothetical protein